MPDGQASFQKYVEPNQNHSSTKIFLQDQEE